MSDIQNLIAKILAAPVADVPNKPVFQNYHHYDGSKWQAISADQNSGQPLKRFRLITWNIDVLSPGGDPRMKVALKHVEELVSRSLEPVVIFFQEMSGSDLNQISEAPWIQSRFYITDPTAQAWLRPNFGPPYGTTTLIDKSLTTMGRPFRVPVPSRFSRDALFVDLNTGASSDRVLRVCNVHLESLVANPPVRPSQVSRVTGFLKANEVGAGLLAGDLNAIEPFDRKLHTDNGLKDAYLELGGQEDADGGYTWGQQAPKAQREQFGCSRMDKSFYCGDIKVVSLARIGEGIEVEEAEKEAIQKAGGETFASDHLGLSIVFELPRRLGGYETWTNM